MKEISKFITIFLLLLNTSCITNIVIDVEPVAEEVPVDLKPLALNVGIYFSPEFKNYEHVRRFSNFRYIAPVGSTSYEMLKKTFSRLFTKVTEIDEATFYGLKNHNFDVLIEPNIEAFHFMLGFDKRSAHHSILYRFNISSADNIPTRIWRVQGLADLALKPFQVVWSHTKSDLDNARSTIYSQATEVFSDFSSANEAIHSSKFKIDPVNFSIDITAQQNDQAANEGKLLSVVNSNNSIIVIHASIHNKSSKAVVLQGYNTRLGFESSCQIAVSGASLVASQTLYPKLRYRQPANLYDILPNVVEQRDQTRSVNTSFDFQVERLKKIQPRKIILAAGDEYKATFYFMPVAGTKAQSSAKLKLWFYDYEMLTSTSVIAEIADFKFDGSPDMREPENESYDEGYLNDIAEN